MLIDKYLPEHDYNEYNYVEIDSASEDIYQKMMQCDLRKSGIAKFLFWLRGMTAGPGTIEHLSRLGFIKLEEDAGREIVYGMITDNPIFSSCCMQNSNIDFIDLRDNGIIKAVINFRVEETGNMHIVSTETRIWCGSNRMRERFRIYWFFVKPFSQLIRRLLLKQIKKDIYENR